jgi:hypothetical protein
MYIGTDKIVYRYVPMMIDKYQCTQGVQMYIGMYNVDRYVTVYKVCTCVRKYVPMNAGMYQCT